MSRPSNLDELEVVYREMNQRWLSQPGKWRFEPSLLEDDSRQCFAIYTNDTFQLEPDTWQRLQSWLKYFSEYGITYNCLPSTEDGLLHFTFHQCSQFASDMRNSYDCIINYSDIINNFIKNLSGIQIQLRGLLITPTGLALRGYPMDNLQVKCLMDQRIKLGDIFRECGLQFDPPYVNDICHLTIFRWTKRPSEDVIKYLQNSIRDWNECMFGVLKPIKWNLGYCTLKMNDVYVKNLLEICTSYFIAHRGLTAGHNLDIENKPESLNERIKAGKYSECDVWYINDKLYLGHDTPEYKVELELLKTPYLYIHAKNREAFEYLNYLRNTGFFDFNVFWHTIEDYIYTSKNEIIVFPGKKLIDKSIYMMPEHDNSALNKRDTYLAKCSDWE